jgi:tRNA (adenine-N(1)-)-methyltransferase non-catalytic subunit
LPTVEEAAAMEPVTEEVGELAFEAAAAEGGTMSLPMCVQPGDCIVLQVNYDEYAMGKVVAGVKIKIGKISCDATALIGVPWGSKLQVMDQLITAGNKKGRSNGSLMPFDEAKDQAVMAGHAPGGQADRVAEAAVKGLNNSAIVDDNKAQAMDGDQIRLMKEGGVRGADLIAGLVQNSSTFAQKTEFSQEKYLRKKQKKHNPIMTVRRPSARTLCQAMFYKEPRKIGFLRVDALGLLLAKAGVRANSKVVVVDGPGGLLTAAACERCGGLGRVFHIHSGAALLPTARWSPNSCSASRGVPE